MGGRLSTEACAKHSNFIQEGQSGDLNPETQSSNVDVLTTRPPGCPDGIKNLYKKRSYGRKDGEKELRFGLIVESFGEHHLTTIVKIDFEVVCVRLQNT